MSDNEMVEVTLVMPMKLAAVFAAQTQFLWSERMQRNLLSILTDDQVAALAQANVNARPLVFPKTVVAVR